LSEHAFFEYRTLLTSTPHVEVKGEPVHCFVKKEIAAQNGRLRRGAELEQEVGDLTYFLLIPDLTAESAILASAKRMNRDYINWVRPPISIASETLKFTFMPPNGHRIPTREELRAIC
jgi:hypothetical protein